MSILLAKSKKVAVCYYLNGLVTDEESLVSVCRTAGDPNNTMW